MNDEPDSCKIVLIGESGVGKTSIINQYVEETFKEDQLTSAGASFSTKKIKLKNRIRKFRKSKFNNLNRIY